MKLKLKVKVKSLSRVRPSVTPWTAAYQAPPSMGFSRQEYWSGVPLPSPFWRLSFHVAYSFLLVQKLLSFVRSHLFIFAFISIALVGVQWQPTPVLLPGKSHGQRILVGCSPCSRKESDTTERLHFHFSLSCIGEGNGNPLHYSCLENRREGGAWWAAIYGAAQSRTRLKWLSGGCDPAFLLRQQSGLD